MTDFQKIIKYIAMVLAIFLIVMIFGGILGGLSLASHIFDKGSDPVHDLSSQSFSKDYTKLDIEISAADFIIEEGDAFSIDSNHKYLKVEEKHDTLKIYDTQRPFNVNSETYTVILTIPKDTVFDEVSIDTGAAKLSVTSLTTYDLDLKLGAGLVTLTDVTVNTETDIEGGAGSLKIENCSFNNLGLDIGVGECDLEAKLFGNSELNCGVGTADFTLIETDDVTYRVEVEKALGTVKLDGKKLEKATQFGNGNSKVEINCGVGDVNINIFSQVQEF